MKTNMRQMFLRAKYFYNDKREIIVPALILAAIAGVVTMLLAVTNMITADRIDEILRQESTAARLKVIAADSFEQRTLDDGGKTVEYYAAIKDGAEIGYVFTAISSGKGSGMIVMTGINIDGKITGVTVIDDNETAGYVGKVERGGLFEKLTGIIPHGKLTVGSDVDGVSQATKTSKGVVDGVNHAVEYFGMIKTTEVE